MTISEPHPYDRLTVHDLQFDGSRRWTLHAPDVIPLWIADMDFPVAPEIVEAVAARARQPLVYPHAEGSPHLKRLLLEKLAQDSGLQGLKPEAVQFMPGVVCGLYWAVACLSEPGDEVLTFTPIYPPFHQAIEAQGRVVSAIPLKEPVEAQDRWEIDWEALEARVKPHQLLMLCHPHNPTGRVWDEEELSRLRALALRYELWVVSDELHADLRHDSVPFQSFGAAGGVEDQTLTLTGPCKTFNTPGLGIGAAIMPGAALRARFQRASVGRLTPPSVLGEVMWQAALEHGEPWLHETLAYLRANREFLQRYVERHWAWARIWPGEATYLAWLDLRAHPQARRMHAFLLDEARVGLQDGPDFAPGALAGRYQGFMRLNYATPRSILEEALERMNRAFTQGG